MIAKLAVARAVFLTSFVFGLLVWGYVVLVQLIYPQWISAPFSHVNVFPFTWRLDDVGMAAFAIAAIGFFLWQVLVNLRST